MMASSSSSKGRLSSYSVVKAIGKGSYGEVFLVKHAREKKQFVMKNIKLTASSAKERLAAEQEASLLSQLQHPNIVSYKESFQDQYGVLHIVMGYCEGGDLCSRLKAFQGQLLPEVQVVEWFVQIALALQYLHERNILHRDLKTQNIFLSKNDIIKVGDLGIARVLDGSCDLAHTVIGTPYYMSPELFANKPYNHKSDIWALGCCVFEMATLRQPFTARNINALMYKILQGKVPPLPPQFSKELSDLVHVMLASSSKERPSVHLILRMDFVRKHIKMFLDRAANRKRKGGHKVPRTAGESSSGGEGVSGGREGVPGGREGPGEAVRRRRSLSDECNREGTDVTDSRPLKLTEPSNIDKKRSTSLTSLPQARGSPRPIRPLPHKPPHKHTTAKKPPHPLPPRPLPPDPVVVVPGNEKGHKNHRIDGSKSPPDRSVAISARERRRRQKQQDKCRRVVLRSRSSSDLQQRRGSGGSSGGEGECPLPQPTGGGEEEVDYCEPDGPVQSERLVALPLPQPVVLPPPQPIVLPVLQLEEESSRVLLQDGEPPNLMAAGSCGGKGNDSKDKGGEGGGHRENGSHDSHSSDEVDEFYTLLDTTLHLPEHSAVKPPREDVPLPRVAFSEPEDDAASPLPSGRLGDRIAALRHECLRGLGAPLMERAYKMLDHLEPEEAEEELLLVLGKEMFDCYAAKLQQLKLCEDSLFGL